MPPKICFVYEGLFPVTFEPGDVVFTTGESPTGQIAFEHAAIVAHRKTIGSKTELCNLRVYGMPESGSRDGQRRPIPGIFPRTQEYPWSLAGRPFGAATFDEKDPNYKSFDTHCARYYMRQLELMMEEYTLDYQTTGVFPPFLTGKVLHANCVGFVSWVVERSRLSLIKYRYPPELEYSSPYQLFKGLRRQPSPGHLARSLTGKVTLPYIPKDSQETIFYCTAARTRVEAAANV